MSETQLRLKIRKNQSTLPLEKIHRGLKYLEILGESIESLPALDHLDQCENLLIVCPNLRELNLLPPHLKILKIKGGFTSPKELPLSLTTLQLSSIQDEAIEFIQLPATLLNLDLSGSHLKTLQNISFGNQLQRINLDNNDFTSLPEHIYQSKSILHLSLDGNPLSEEEKDKVFKTFGIWF